MSDAERMIASSVRRHLAGGALFLCLLLTSVFAWSAFMQISGAVIASGTIVVESSTKTVQHRDGGIVKDILVRNGDEVEAGQVLIRLDDTVERANLAIVTKQLDELMAIEARLSTERDGAVEIVFPTSLSARRHEPQIAAVLHGQAALLDARRKSLKGRIDQLGEQIGQIKRQIEGLRVSLEAKEQEIGLISRELAAVETLYEKNLVSINRIMALRRDRARLTGERGSLISEIGRAGQAIGERRIQTLQIREAARAEVLQALQDTRSRIAGLTEQKIAAQDRMRRIEIRAPRSGFVHRLSIHTEGGVIAAAEPVLHIVPREDVLLIEAQVRPADIDQLSTGQDAMVRFPNFSQRQTPELAARVLTISAQTTRDETSGLDWYTARLGLDEAERRKLGASVLLPGMPAEVLIRTRDRTVLSYLLKPLTDQIVHAMKEE